MVETHVFGTTYYDVSEGYHGGKGTQPTLSSSELIFICKSNY